MGVLLYTSHANKLPEDLMEDVLNVALDNVKDKSPQFSIKKLLPGTDEAHLSGVMQ